MGEPTSRSTPPGPAALSRRPADLLPDGCRPRAHRRRQPDARHGLRLRGRRRRPRRAPAWPGCPGRPRRRRPRPSRRTSSTRPSTVPSPPTPTSCSRSSASTTACSTSWPAGPLRARRRRASACASTSPTSRPRSRPVTRPSTTSTRTTRDGTSSSSWGCRVRTARPARPTTPGAHRHVLGPALDRQRPRGLAAARRQARRRGPLGRSRPALPPLRAAGRRHVGTSRGSRPASRRLVDRPRARSPSSRSRAAGSGCAAPSRPSPSTGGYAATVSVPPTAVRRVPDRRPPVGCACARGRRDAPDRLRRLDGRALEQSPRTRAACASASSARSAPDARPQAPRHRPRRRGGRRPAVVHRDGVCRGRRRRAAAPRARLRPGRVGPGGGAARRSPAGVSRPTSTSRRRAGATR